jgi:acetylornithine deacetylase/succinyl-diaminopimelate desuccinylase-like protein
MMDFASKGAAFDWLADELDHDCCDNFRFCFLDDPAGIAEYEKQVAYGCCGSRDLKITVLGRPAQVGCNYGH